MTSTQKKHIDTLMRQPGMSRTRKYTGRTNWKSSLNPLEAKTVDMMHRKLQAIAILRLGSSQYTCIPRASGASNTYIRDCSPNKALVAEGFLFVFNRIDPADQDFRPSRVAARLA
jgi:hypothetical protein